MAFIGLALNLAIFLTAVLLLVASSEKAVKKIGHLLHYYGFSASFAGLAIMATITSLPEILTHLTASAGILAGTLDYGIASSTALGANIGSDVVQQTLILGLVVLLAGKFVFRKDFLRTAYLPMIGTTLMTLFLGWDGILSRIDGLILFATFVLYMAFLYRRERSHVHETVARHKRQHKKRLWLRKDLGILIAAFALMLVSATVLLSSAEEIVLVTGLGGSLIGVITLGIASAAPEFFTAVSAIRHKNASLSIGTLVGSNITNPLVAIGLGAMISTYNVPKPLLLWDLPMETVTAALLFVYLLKTRGKLGKAGAFYLILLYVFYITARVFFFPVD
jgi:cation:H+ antiporter